MLKASKNDPKNPLIIMGISEDNVVRLKNDQPIKVSIRSFGINLPGEIVIVYGKTEKVIENQLRSVNIIPSDVSGDIDPKLVAHSTVKTQHEKILIATVGLPRSGKSTWAKSQAYPIVNPDSVRLAIHGQRFIGSAEPYVWATVKAMVRSLFLSGHQIVILDACNNTQKRRDEWISSEWATYFKVIDTSTDVCFDRAATENDQAIISVIERMAKEHEPLTDEEQARIWL